MDLEGIASLGQGMLPAECIIKEHYRLGSSCVILSRSFCDTSKIQGLDRIRTIFVEGVQKIRDLEDECRLHSDYFTVNQKMISEIIKKICK